MMKIGLGTYALAWSIGVQGNLPKKPMDIYAFLDFAKTLGYNLVQIADNLPLDIFTEKELENIFRRSKELGIEIEIGTRGLVRENVWEYIKIARQLDSSLLRVVIDKNDYEPGLQEINAILRELIPELEKQSIVLAIENHDRLKAAEFAKIVQKADSPYVGICLDSVNSIGADEGFEEVFQLLSGHTVNLHLKDYVIRRKSHMMGFDITGTPAGQGFIPIPKIMKTLQIKGKCKSVILELWPPPEPTIEATIEKEKKWVEESTQFLFDNFK
jgi:3-oxoisoapionate decarboxylase